MYNRRRVSFRDMTWGQDTLSECKPCPVCKTAASLLLDPGLEVCPAQDFHQLKGIKANGGNGGTAQLGGNGDRGRKGKDGEDGKAADTSWSGSGQTCISWGKEGKEGGPGGAPGKTGLSGRAGCAGKIRIEHANEAVDISQMAFAADGVAASCVLRGTAHPPIGGEGGEPGAFGLDHVKDKGSTWSKQKERHMVLDREKMKATIKHRYKGHVSRGEDIESTNHNAWFSLLGIIPLLISTTAQVDRIDLHEAVANQEEYRNRDRNKAHRRGKDHEGEAHLREDKRDGRGPQRPQRNVDCLELALNDLIDDAKETSGEAEHAMARDETAREIADVEDELAQCQQHAAHIDTDQESVQAKLEQRQAELEKTQTGLDDLRAQVDRLDLQSVSAAHNLMREIERSQKARDRSTQEKLRVEQLVESLNNEKQKEDSLKESREDLLRLLDEQLGALRIRRKAHAEELRRLKQELLKGNQQMREKRENRKHLQALLAQRVRDIHQDHQEVEMEEDQQEQEQEQEQEQDVHVHQVEAEELELEIPASSSDSCIFYSPEPFLPSDLQCTLQEKLVEKKHAMGVAVRASRAGVLPPEQLLGMLSQISQPVEKGFSVTLEKLCLALDSQLGKDSFEEGVCKVARQHWRACIPKLSALQIWVLGSWHNSNLEQLVSSVTSEELLQLYQHAASEPETVTPSLWSSFKSFFRTRCHSPEPETMRGPTKSYMDEKLLGALSDHIPVPAVPPPELQLFQEASGWIQSLITETMLCQLSQVERVLLMENLQKVCDKLGADRLVPLTSTFQDTFVIAALEKIRAPSETSGSIEAFRPADLPGDVARKLRQNMEGPRCVHHELEAQIGAILELLQSDGIFHLELCASRPAECPLPLSELELALVRYSQTWFMDKAKSSLAKEQLCQRAKEANLSLMGLRTQQLSELVEAFLKEMRILEGSQRQHFFRALKANLRSLCIFALDWIREESADIWEFRKLESTVQSALQTSSSHEAACSAMNDFFDVIAVFRKLTGPSGPIVAGSSSKASSNRNTASLLQATRRLLLFIDGPESRNQSGEILAYFKSLAEHQESSDFCGRIQELQEKLEALEAQHTEFEVETGPSAGEKTDKRLELLRGLQAHLLQEYGSAANEESSLPFVLSLLRGCDQWSDWEAEAKGLFKSLGDRQKEAASMAEKKWDASFTKETYHKEYKDFEYALLVTPSLSGAGSQHVTCDISKRLDYFKTAACFEQKAFMEALDFFMGFTGLSSAPRDHDGTRLLAALQQIDALLKGTEEERTLEVLSGLAIKEADLRKELGFIPKSGKYLVDQRELQQALHSLRERATAAGGLQALLDRLKQVWGRDVCQEQHNLEYRYVLELCNPEHLRLEKVAEKLNSESLSLDVSLLLRSRYTFLCEEAARGIFSRLLDIASQVPSQEQLAASCHCFWDTVRLLETVKSHDFQRHKFYESLQKELCLLNMLKRSPSEAKEWVERVESHEFSGA